MVGRAGFTPELWSFLYWVLSHFYLRMKRGKKKRTQERKRREEKGKSEKERGEEEERRGTFLRKRNNIKPGMVVHTCNPSTQEVEVGGLKVQGQPGLHNESLSLKKIF
jgi:hypothetical protein